MLHFLFDSYNSMDFLPSLILAILRDIVGLFPYHHNKTSCDLFAGGGSYLPFVKKTKQTKKNAINLQYL